MITLNYGNKSNVLPFIELNVDHKPYVFLVDSGASISSLSSNFYEGLITGKKISSIGIDNVPVKCEMTPPLPVTSKDVPSLFKMHDFAIIPNSPFCLLGRDLMHKLGMKLDFDADSLTLMFPAAFSITTDTGSALVDDLPATVLPQEFSGVNPQLWAEHKDDVGLIDVRPYRANLITNRPVFQKQYPLSKEKEEGIAPLIEQLLAQGILVRTHSPYNTPINPIKKANGSWRLTQDLRKINDLIKPLAPIVPDVQTIINSIPSEHAFFSVIDLSSAFFSMTLSHCLHFVFRIVNTCGRDSHKGSEILRLFSPL